MGLIKAAMGAAGGVMADQWKEYFYCEALPVDVLAVRGRKKVSGRSSNKGGDNVISNGSLIAVADGQCMLIVDQGKIVDVCAEPGEYTYDMSTEPSVFTGSLGAGISAVFKNIGKRFTFGGETPKEQRVYYFNTKEITGNKYGTPSPVPFRVVAERAGIDLDIGIRCFGAYSYRITNPLLFYTNVCGNVSEDYTRDKIDDQLKSELLTALQPAFARVGETGVRYSGLTAHTKEISKALNDELSAEWKDVRGLEIVSFGVSSVKASEEDEQMIKEMQREAAYMDPTRAAGALSRAGSIGFEKIPVDASSKMPDDHMDSIEPYDYSGLKEFSTAYLPGFLADKYDVSVKDSQKRADTRCASTLEDALRGTVTGYDSCTLEHKQIDLKRGKVHYALLPVWMLHTKWNGQDFLFAMNGQTGKMVGDLPTSKGKFWGLFAAIAAPMTVVLTIILMLS